MWNVNGAFFIEILNTIFDPTSTFIHIVILLEDLRVVKIFECVLASLQVCQTRCAEKYFSLFILNVFMWLFIALVIL
jgi:hypothetical protein